jgi:large subunit ribosomal protein L25
METVALNVRSREETGKGVARSLRRQAQLPAVFYGRGLQPVPLAVKAGEVDKLISSAAGENVLIDLNIERDGSTQSHRAMIKEIQVDPLKQTILHVDFYAISMDEKISLEVPVTLTGEAVGVSEGGILQQVRRSIEINCLPDRIPEALEVDVSNLAIGDSLHVSDLGVPEGVEVLAEERLTVATVVPPAKEEEIIAEIPEEEEEREEVEEEAVTETEEEGDKE